MWGIDGMLYLELWTLKANICVKLEFSSTCTRRKYIYMYNAITYNMVEYMLEVLEQNVGLY